VKSAQASNGPILDDEPIGLNLRKASKGINYFFDFLFTHCSVQGYIKFDPVFTTVFVKAGYVFEGEISCQGSGIEMAITHIYGVGTIIQGGEEAFNVSCRCQ
jgi:hypothetical protein